MRQLFVIVFVCALGLGQAVSYGQDSQVYIDVGQAQIKKSLLALTPLVYVGTQASNASHIRTGQNLFQVIQNDLTVSNYFEFIKPEAYLEDPAKVGLRPAPGTQNGFNFQNWKTIGTEFLIRAAYNVIGGDLVLEVYVYHVPTTKLVLGKTYKGTLASLRRVAHTFANDVLQALTGKKGMFLTKIVASGQPKELGPKEIFVMDWDGSNQTRITSHQHISVSPAWSWRGDKIAYTSFAYHKAHKVRNADLFIYELITGRRLLTSYRKGLNSGAAFIPGDLQLLLTMSNEGTSDIYRLNADGTSPLRLTNGPNRSMNVEPSVSPDGKFIAFSSDRAGRPNVYIMNIDGSNPRRLTQVGKYNASPAWSPDGKTIAFAGDDRGAFDIFTINVDGTNLKRLTDARKPSGKRANNESPTWSPDGRHILFSSDRTGKYQLYIVSPDGSNERRITNDDYNWDKPKWSPFLD